jgi:hypothetical protein
MLAPQEFSHQGAAKTADGTVQNQLQNRSFGSLHGE